MLSENKLVVHTSQQELVQASRNLQIHRLASQHLHQTDVYIYIVQLSNKCHMPYSIKHSVT